MERKGICLNKKHGELYTALGEVTNATNAQDGQVMVLYINYKGQLFVREKEEFDEKFEQAGRYSECIKSAEDKVRKEKGKS